MPRLSWSPLSRLRGGSLRRELVITLVLKLCVLLAIKFAFFPTRLPADTARRGVDERLASTVSAQPATARPRTRQQESE